MKVGDILTFKTSLDFTSRSLQYWKERKYEIIEIYKKKYPEQDLILCREKEHGYRECFQRQDVEEKLGIKRKNKVEIHSPYHKVIGDALGDED